MTRGATDGGALVLVRHGATEWSLTGRHTGRTDLPLVEEGRAAARALSPRIASWNPRLVWCSPLLRARETAEYARIPVQAYDADLQEWDYGAWEGLTTQEIRESLGDPTWTVWNSARPSPGQTPGESMDEVAARADRVISRVTPMIAAGDRVVLVAHGHLLRILTARWLGLKASGGALFRFETAGTATLGFERDNRVIIGWDGGLSAP